MIKILNIGKSASYLKIFSIKKYSCINNIYFINNANSANLYNIKGSYKISIHENVCTVERIDVKKGWDFNLFAYIDVHTTKNKVNLSLTTLPERLISFHFKKVYNSLINQNINFDKLIINLEIRNFQYKIPKYLILNKNVIFNNSNKIGSCIKLLGALDILANDDVVIIMDDDIVMRPNFIEVLFKSFEKNPQKVYGIITEQSNISKLYKYNEIRGFSGYILKITHNIRKFEDYYKSMPKCAKFIDDQWISWVFYNLEINVQQQKFLNKPMEQILDIPNTDPHPVWYELCKNTPRSKLEKQFLEYIKKLK